MIAIVSRQLRGSGSEGAGKLTVLGEYKQNKGLFARHSYGKDELFYFISSHLFFPLSIIWAASSKFVSSSIPS